MFVETMKAYNTAILARQMPVPSSRSFLTFEDATRFLVEEASEQNVLHLSYWYLQFEAGLPDQVIWVSTYDPEYMREYMQRFTPMGDPVIGTVMDQRVVDWAEWLSADGVSEDILKTASKYGLTKYGVSMPLPAPGSDKIIFSVCIDSNDIDWQFQRLELIKRLKPTALEFSARLRTLIAAGQKGASVYAL
ncbi:MAG: autoinducer binding domain-containing protein [Aestuariivirga sp.]